MNKKPDSHIHFPTSQDKGAVPFPHSQTSDTGNEQGDQAKPADPQGAADEQKPDDAAEPELSQEELRLMADTMPGDGPGD
ncbi:hypothetical protein CR105_07310 [Massilia eurypsychrophila]|uniref:Uncharacterized protein n=1 Tax=Massilia eurypsychrophila TaxID=1485217 RepID=A0A2G8TIH6_9BURK|nr:hypothetical protein [Massilia eurypsychrophila]PIL45856.1 hypothetical protein CR105_07310 [Massilia eurypsychrophila]